jgi:hypothetical protein
VRDVAERELRRITWAADSTTELLERGLDAIASGRDTPYSVAGEIVRALLR